MLEEFVAAHVIKWEIVFLPESMIFIVEDVTDFNFAVLLCDNLSMC